MRQEFAAQLYLEMEKNENIIVLVGDLGYKMFDKIRDSFPDRFVNCGAAEQAMLGIAAGLAMEGKIPVVYSISTFLLYRPYELIRNYIAHECLNVKLVASGRDFDYAHDGFSHHSPEAKQVLDTMPEIKQLWPETKEEIETMVKDMFVSTQPVFISLRR